MNFVFRFIYDDKKENKNLTDVIKLYPEAMDLVNTSSKKITYFYSTFANLKHFLPKNTFYIEKSFPWLSYMNAV